MSAAAELLADIICAEIATAAVEAGIQMTYSMPVNAGQQTLCLRMQDDIMGSWDDIYEGNPPIIIDTDHPDAVGEIAGAISEVLTEAAEACKDVREAADKE